MLCLPLKQPCGRFALEVHGDLSDPHDWQAVQRLPRPALRRASWRPQVPKPGADGLPVIRVAAAVALLELDTPKCCFSAARCGATPTLVDGEGMQHSCDLCTSNCNIGEAKMWQ